jgi:hypothetical protein
MTRSLFFHSSWKFHNFYLHTIVVCLLKLNKYMMVLYFGVVASNEEATHASLMKEFSLFWRIDVNIGKVANPLKWWKENEVRFPNVGSLAWQFLALLGSQIETEHAFNATSLFTSLQWCRLDTSNLDSFIMIYKKWSMMHTQEVAHEQNMIYKNFLHKSQPSWWQWRQDRRWLLEYVLVHLG